MEMHHDIYCDLVFSSDSKEIRLLELLPASWAADIRCNLMKVSFDACPAYEALSYVWGDPSNGKTIFVSNKLFTITQNLHDALFRLRRPAEPRFLWVDAVCINQKSVLEKNSQIQLMRQIYERAACVIVFLGDLDNHHSANRIGLSMVPKLVEASKIAKRIRMTSSLDDHDHSLHLKNLERVGLPSPNPFLSEYAAFGEIIGRPWFRRVWVLQEIAVSAHARVICADENVSWSEFVEAVKFCRVIGITPYYIDPIVSFWSTSIAKLQKAVQSGVRFTMLDLLLSFRHCLATGPRDKVFALCGLVANDSPNIIPYYSLGTLDVYKTIAVQILRETDCLDILNVPRNSKVTGIEDLPSWVPDWSGVDRFCTAFLTREGADEVRYNFSATKSSQASINIDNSGRILRLTGVRVDRVKDRGDVLIDSEWRLKILHEDLSSNQDNNEATDKIHQLIRSNVREREIFAQWEKLAAIRSKVRYPTGESHSDVYRKTLVANHMPEGESASKAAFEDWLNHQRRMRLLPKFNKPFYQVTGVYLMQFVYRMLGKKISGEFQLNMVPVLGRRLARTEMGYLALIPDISEVGDQIWLLKGAKFPIVLRPDPLNLDYELVGASYVHGIMHGEAFDAAKCSEVVLR